MLKNLALTFVRGFSMGAADIVPGVSGGTIALVFGIYEQLLANVRLGASALGSLVRFDGKSFLEKMKSVEWSFLLPLALGLGTAVAALTSIIESLLDDYPEELSGFFFGLVIASILVAWKLLDSYSPVEILLLLSVSAVSFFLLGFQSGPIADPPLWAFFAAGSVAICAMILPGISGSFILLMMGMYAGVLGAVHDRAVVNILLLAVGAILGLAIFSSLLGYLLDNFYSIVIVVLIGLMVGSLRILWPWPNGVGIISEEQEKAISGTGIELPANGEFLVPTALAIAAFVAVMAISKIAEKVESV